MPLYGRMTVNNNYFPFQIFRLHVLGALSKHFPHNELVLQVPRKNKFILLPGLLKSPLYTIDRVKPLDGT